MKNLPHIIKAKEEILKAIATGYKIKFNFSGGKDSHAIVGLLCEMIREKTITSEVLKNISVFHSDTTIEYPLLVNLTLKTLAYLKSEYEINCNIGIAPTSELFFATLFGQGIGIPHNRNRWCTKHLKIKPSSSKNCIQITGEHFGESVNRDNKLSGCGSSECGIDLLPKNNKYTPILDWSNCQVWDYLFYLDSAGIFYDNFFNQIDSVYSISNDDEKDTSLRMGCISCPVVSVKRSYNTDSKGVPTKLGLSLRLIFEEMRNDDIRLLNPRAPKNGTRTHGAISIYARRYYWKYVKKLNQKFKEAGVTLISLEEEEYIEDSLYFGRYPKTYKPEKIRELEWEWFTRCPKWLADKIEYFPPEIKESLKNKYEFKIESDKGIRKKKKQNSKYVQLSLLDLLT